jgi:hypothetical protein
VKVDLWVFTRSLAHKRARGEHHLKKYHSFNGEFAKQAADVVETELDVAPAADGSSWRQTGHCENFTGTAVPHCGHVLRLVDHMFVPSA